MNVAAGLLRQWHRENPARLLQTALLQAERLAQMAPELEALRAQIASLHQQLEVQTKRIAQLEEALAAAWARRAPPSCTFSCRAPKTFRGAQAAGARAWTSGRLPAQARSYR
jgi:hypothetical protein